MKVLFVRFLFVCLFFLFLINFCLLVWLHWFSRFLTRTFFLKRTVIVNIVLLTICKIAVNNERIEQAIPKLSCIGKVLVWFFWLILFDNLNKHQLAEGLNKCVLVPCSAFVEMVNGEFKQRFLVFIFFNPKIYEMSNKFKTCSGSRSSASTQTHNTNWDFSAVWENFQKLYFIN